MEAGARAWRDLPRTIWLVPVGFVLAGLGTLLPWFRPTAPNQILRDLHAWDLGKLGLLVLLALLLATVEIVKIARRPREALPADGDEPAFVVPTAICMLWCAAGLVILIVLYLLVPHFYDLHPITYADGPVYGGPNVLRVIKSEVDRGTAAGFVLTAAGAVIGFAGSCLALGRVKPAKRRGLTHIPPTAALPSGSAPHPLGVQG